MVYNIDNTKVWLACISTKRPTNVRKIHKHCVPTFYTAKNEEHWYLLAGAKSVIEVDGNIVVARNKAIADAKANGCDYCLQLSDDVRRFLEFTSDKTKNVVTFGYVLRKIVGLGNGYDLIGTSINHNPRNYKKSYFVKNRLVVNDCILIKSDLLYDEQANLKEDYDMFLQLMTTGRRVLRIDNIAGEFPHRENKGGANTYRTYDFEKSCNDYIISKWNGLIKAHPTRRNQVAIDYSKLRKTYGI